MRIRVSVSVSGFVLPGALEGESSRASHGAAFVPKLERMACVGLGLGLELVLVLGRGLRLVLGSRSRLGLRLGLMVGDVNVFLMTNIDDDDPFAGGG